MRGKINLSLCTPWRRIDEWNVCCTHSQSDTRWVWLAIITLRPRYFHWNNPSPLQTYPLNLSLGGPPQSVWKLWRKYSYLSPVGNGIAASWTSGPSLVTVLAELPWLSACKLNLSCNYVSTFPFENVSASLYTTNLLFGIDVLTVATNQCPSWWRYIWIIEITITTSIKGQYWPLNAIYIWRLLNRASLW